MVGVVALVAGTAFVAVRRAKFSAVESQTDEYDEHTDLIDGV